MKGKYSISELNAVHAAAGRFGCIRIFIRVFCGQRLPLAALVFSLCGTVAQCEEVRVAVAANFLGTLRDLEPVFSELTGHRIATTAGSTGLLYAQIRNGAPFDVLLSADRERPRLLVEDGFGEASETFTYAVGRLVLWSGEPGRVGESTLSELADVRFRWIAIADPATAPYGAAARQVLQSLGFWDVLQARLVRGQNVAQTFAMTETGNAELGLVSLAQALAYRGAASFAVVPHELHEPIRQDAVLLDRGIENAAAQAFVEFLRSPAAAAIIERSGYAVFSARM